MGECGVGVRGVWGEQVWGEGVWGGEERREKRVRGGTSSEVKLEEAPRIFL